MTEPLTHPDPYLADPEIEALANTLAAATEFRATADQTANTLPTAPTPTHPTLQRPAAMRGSRPVAECPTGEGWWHGGQ